MSTNNDEGVGSVGGADSFEADDEKHDKSTANESRLSLTGGGASQHASTASAAAASTAGGQSQHDNTHDGGGGGSAYSHRRKRIRTCLLDLPNDDAAHRMMTRLGRAVGFDDIDKAIEKFLERATKRSNDQASTTTSSRSSAGSTAVVVVERVVKLDAVFVQEMETLKAAFIQQAFRRFSLARHMHTQQLELALKELLRKEVQCRIDGAIEHAMDHQLFIDVHSEDLQHSWREVQKLELEELKLAHKVNTEQIDSERYQRETLQREKRTRFQDIQKETCSICMTEFTLAKEGNILWCYSSHFMCHECSGVFCKSTLSDLQSNYPPNCPTCHIKMPKSQFKAVLTDKQLAAVEVHVAKVVHNNRSVIQCQKCSHFEVFQKPGPAAWRCKACRHGTCLVCHQDLPKLIGSSSSDGNRDHARCKALRGIKAKVEKAIEDGFQVKCPKCGLSGRKDDACLHMKCPKPDCQTEFCYLCGLSVDDCDKAPLTLDDEGVDDIYLHNRDWETNPRRCPMYLTQIEECDLRWAGESEDDDYEDDSVCLDHFHRFRTIQNLQKVMKEEGEDTLAAVFEHFPSIKASGFTVEQVKNNNTDQLINRDDYIRRLREEEADNEDDNENGEEGTNGPNEVARGDEFEEVPEEMTNAVIQEEAQVREAIAASLEDAQEAEPAAGEGTTNAPEADQNANANAPPPVDDRAARREAIRRQRELVARREIGRRLADLAEGLEEGIDEPAAGEGTTNAPEADQNANANAPPPVDDRAARREAFRRQLVALRRQHAELENAQEAAGNDEPGGGGEGTTNAPEAARQNDTENAPALVNQFWDDQAVRREIVRRRLLELAEAEETDDSGDGGDDSFDIDSDSLDALQEAIELAHQNAPAEEGTQEDNDAAFEDVPEEMTRAVVQEEEEVQRASEASRASAEEDEHLRRVLAETSQQGR